MVAEIILYKGFIMFGDSDGDGVGYIGHAPLKVFGDEKVGYTQRVSATDYAVNVARGQVEGSQMFSAYGKLTASSAVTNNLVWANGTFFVPDQVDGVQVEIVSTHAGDSEVGIGIRTLHIHYLDGDWEPQTTDITLNGTTPVTTTPTDIKFIQCAHMVTYGSSKHAEGDIVFRKVGTPTEEYNMIAALSNRCSSSARMVPAGKTLFISGLVGGSISGTAAAGATLEIGTSYFYDQDYTQDAILIPQIGVGLQDSSATFSSPIPAPFPEKTVIGILVTTDKAAIISASWVGWIEDNI